MTQQDRGYGVVALDNLMKRVSNVVGRFHWEKHKHAAHPYLEKVCKEMCNPEKETGNPKNQHLFDEEGKRIFNSEMQETVANYSGPFQKIVRSMSALHAEFSMFSMYSLKNEITFRELLDSGENPRYLAEAEDIAYYEQL